MSDGLIAQASIAIDAPVARVWDALVNPAVIKQYMFGTNVSSDFKKGSPIVWRGEWEGKSYEDKGVILDVEPERMLRYTHTSGNQSHVVTVELTLRGASTLVSLSQDGNATEEEREHSQKNWEMMLGSLKKLLEA